MRNIIHKSSMILFPNVTTYQRWKDGVDYWFHCSPPLTIRQYWVSVKLFLYCMHMIGGVRKTVFGSKGHSTFKFKICTYFKKNLPHKCENLVCTNFVLYLGCFSTTLNFKQTTTL